MRKLDFDGLRPKSPFLTTLHDEWRRKARAFVDAQIAPHLRDWNAAGTFPDALYKEAARSGLLGMGFPREYGGTGSVDLYHRVILAEEFFRLGSSVVFADLATHWIALPPILAAAPAALCERIARPVIAGDKRMAFAVTEPSGGSDVGAFGTVAERKGDVYIVSGEKTLISGATRADYLLTAVRTGGRGSGGLSLLLIEADRPGVTTASIAGLHWYNRNNGSIRFENVEVPADQLIGDENNGFAGLAHQFNIERFSGIAATLAMARAALVEAIEFARARQTFGKRVIDHQVIRHKIVEMIQRVDLTYAYLDNVAWRFEQGETPVAELSMLKVAANRTLEHCARECMQVLGGSAYTSESTVERIYREARSFAVAGGAEEVLFDLVARQLRF